MAPTGRPGRRSRGLKSDLCSSCKSGNNPAIPKTFDPKCEGCQAKLARHNARQSCPCKQDPECSKCCDDRILGLRTGLEPDPKTYCLGNWKLRNMTPEQKEASQKRLEMVHAGRRRSRGVVAQP